MRVAEAGVEAASIVRSLVSSSMGRFHGYYAYQAVRGGARVLLLYDDSGKVRGVEVFYKASIGGVEACVHYYVVVVPGWRGRGLGKVLVASAEEVCNSTIYLATTTEDNVSSRRMFTGLCYKGLSWSEVEEAYGWDAVSELVRLTCGYEDDIILVKPFKKLGALVEELRVYGVPSSVWDSVCYRPWRMLFRI